MSRQERFLVVMVVLLLLIGVSANSYEGKKASNDVKELYSSFATLDHNLHEVDVHVWQVDRDLGVASRGASAIELVQLERQITDLTERVSAQGKEIAQLKEAHDVDVTIREKGDAELKAYKEATQKQLDGLRDRIIALERCMKR
jgi:flagellar biosynthesis chaperone FliJ